MKRFILALLGATLLGSSAWAQGAPDNGQSQDSGQGQHKHHHHHKKNDQNGDDQGQQHSN